MLARHRTPQAARLATATRRFRAVPGRRFVLRHDPDVDPLDLALVARTLELEIGMQERRFERPLRGWRMLPTRLPVYLFRSAEALSQVYGEPVGGFASWHGWMIAVHPGRAWDEAIPHELAHIFAGWWNPHAPRVLQEGLAVWVQRTFGGQPADSYVRRRYPSVRQAVASLFGPEPAAGNHDRLWYYIVAGSFTGFLLRRAGWGHFREFYRDRSITTETFPGRFEKHYGLKLETAGRVWFGQLPGCSLTDPPFAGWM